MAMRNIYQPRRRQAAILLTVLAAVAVLMVMLGKCSHSPSPFSSNVTKSGGDTLDIAIEMNPAVYRVKGDTVTGHDYQLLQHISKEHGVPMKFHPFVPLDHAIEGLNNGTFDMVVSSFPLTAQLKEDFLMTDPVYVDREVLVQLRDTATLISSQMQLGGDTVWVPAGASFANRLSNLSEEIGDTIYVMSSEKYSSELLFILVAKGAIRLAVINEDIAAELAPHYPQVDISLPISFNQFQSWAIRKDNTALADSVNKWISTLPNISAHP